jgi:electron transfer flavoprotein alpha subunit
MPDFKDVLVIGEISDGKLAPITLELLGAGRKLADDLGQSLGVTLAGSGLGDAAKDAIAFGADKAFVTDDPLLRDYQSDSFVSVADKVIKQVNPQVLLLGQTAVGRDLAPRLAFRLGTAVTADCLKLEIDPASKKLLQTKPVYGGNALAVYQTDTFPQVATVRAKVMTPPARNDGRQGEVIKVDAGLTADAIRAKFLEKVPEKVEGIKLEDARIVISGGRGIGSPEGFEQLKELARTLKGAVGASRPAVDNGWAPAGLQVGLTGKIIAPEVYIAVGISGTSQHLAGCSGAKHVIAINKDPESNIFKAAEFGVVGDWKKVLPAFTQKLKELMAG